MAINIHVDQPTFIPITFGTVELQFPLDDLAIERVTTLSTIKLTDKWKLIAEHEVTEENLSQVMDELREILRELYDTLLGPGAFETLYTAYPSVVTLVEGFFALMEEIPTEIQAHHKKVEKAQRNKLEKLRQKRK